MEDPNRGRVADLWRVHVTGGEGQPTGVSVRGMIRLPGMHPDGHRIAFESLDNTVAQELWALEDFLPKTRVAR